MKNYSKNTMKNWTKQELIEHIEDLQYNLKCEENLNNHMYKTILTVCKKYPKFSNALGEVLEVWNKNNGHRYDEEIENGK